MKRSTQLHISWRVAACLLAVTIVLAVSAASASAALVADYKFDYNLNSSVGLAPPLTEVGSGSPTFTTDVVNGTIEQVRVFPAGAGLALATSGLVSPEVYTFEITFKLSEASTWERVFDASNATTDNGVYVKNNKLDYYDNSSGGDHFGVSGFAADTYYTVAISRSINGLITIYQDGVPQISYNDASNTGVLKSPDYPARFFIDDIVVSGENSPGAVARIRVFDSDIPVTTADKNGTATKVHCNYVVASGLNTCFAQVADARPGTTKRPNGQVKFSSANGGSFLMGNTCDLVPTSASPNVSSCSVQYLSPSNTFPKVAAAYLGSDEHTPSTGTTTFYILGGKSSGFGVDLGTDPTLGTKTSGPMTVGCSSASAKSSGVVISFTGTKCWMEIVAEISEAKNRFTGRPCTGAKTWTELKNCNPHYEEALEEWERRWAQDVADLEDLIDLRTQKWEELKDIIDDYNKTAKEIINRADKKSSLIVFPQIAKKKRSKAIQIGRVRTVVNGGKQKTVRLKLTRQWKPLATMIRRMNKALPGLNLGVNVSLKVESTRRAKGAKKPKRKVIKRVVAYKVSP